MWLHGNLGLLMNTTYPLWFESFHPAEKIQKASLPAPAAFLYPSQWFTPTQLLYLINKHLTTAAGLGVLTLERPRQAWAGHQLWQQETAPRQHWENSSCKSQSQSRHKGLPISSLVWGIHACLCLWIHTSVYYIYGYKYAFSMYQTLNLLTTQKKKFFFDLQCSWILPFQKSLFSPCHLSSCLCT